MAERELVLVELKEGTSCRMAKPALRVFLTHGGVTRFKHSDDWVVVGKDQLRAPKNDHVYHGVERREVV
ncbi:MAG: hypothetical protein JRE56_00130 [Deltaproteobacteria bacterium]|jgi:hypothetical protein|nr:hypothetical protein [Deltaproteobacteria bacterium]MBW2512054.1 hypothetical protein [Deltaproteobacteria bacterium]